MTHPSHDDPRQYHSMIGHTESFLNATTWNFGDNTALISEFRRPCSNVEEWRRLRRDGAEKDEMRLLDL